MKKAFLKISSTYSTNNKLKELISERLIKLDCGLYPSLAIAKSSVLRAFRIAVHNYHGRAKIPEISVYDIKNGVGIQVPEVIIIDIHEVSIDLCQE